MEQEISDMKLCRKCGIIKLKNEFNKDKFKRDGYYTMCKSCKRNYRISPKYRERERELEKTQPYKERQRRFYSTAKGKSYASLEEHRSSSSLSRNIHTLTHNEWNYIKDKQEHKCAICGVLETQETKLVHDCIIPLSKGGVFCFTNVQALCNHCNSVKGSKIYSDVAPGSVWRKEHNGDSVFADAKLLSSTAPT
jgi:hypothetical protein